MEFNMDNMKFQSSSSAPTDVEPMDICKQNKSSGSVDERDSLNDSITSLIWEASDEQSN